MPSRALLLLGLATPSVAWATFPENVDLTSMPDHDGEAVLDPQLLGEDFRQLVMELGTMVSNKPNLPASTLGVYGFDVDIGAQFALTEARFREGQPSPWARANTDELSPAYQVLPTVTVRKGLPLSTEVGATFGWIGGTTTGVFGGFARIAVFENYKPFPDISLKAGYAGYVGNDQLDVGVLDLGVTVGSSFPVGGIPSVNTGRIAPFASFTTLRISANPTIDEDIEEDIGALRYANSPGADGVDPAPTITLPNFGIGAQFLAGTAHLKIAACWAPATIPAISTGFGFTF